MTFKEILEKFGKKNYDRKELINEIDMQRRAEETVGERTKSANRRELEKYYKEDEEARIKKALEFARKKRQKEIDFGHNPLNAKNVTHSDYEILKDKNLFKERKNMFIGQKNIVKGNKNLFKHKFSSIK